MRRALREKRSRFAGTKQVLTTLNQPAHRVVHDLESSAKVPIGGILPYGGSTAPAGWLLCNGSAVSRRTYRGLFSVVGTTYGVGDGSTTFNIPDLRSRVPLGAGTYASLGANDGDAEAARTTAHTHAAGTLDVETDHNIENNTDNTGGANRATNGGHNITGSTASALPAADFPHLGVNFIIKA